MEVVVKLTETLNTLTEETETLVYKKCQELGFNPDRGEISLKESFINLHQAKNILSDAIKKRKMAQLPLTVQKSVLASVESIKAFQTNLISGSDEVVNLVNAIEQLYTSIWTFGFHHISDELLGYLTKMNQLKDQEVKIHDLNQELDKGLQLKSQLEELLLETKKSSESMQTILANSQLHITDINANAEKSLKISQESSAHLTTTSQNDQSVTQLLANSKASGSEISTLEGKIKEFFAAIDAYKAEIETSKVSTKGIIDKNNGDTASLIVRLKSLEDQIKEQITRATGHSLFHSFQTRQEALKYSKKIWASALGLLVLISVGLTLYIAISSDQFNMAFYIKLSMSIPLIYAIAFCSVQYTRERKLEEEYAFKSNISISLMPYKELVEKLVVDNPDEKAKYTAFIIDTINKVFTSPTRRIFDKSQSDVKPDFAIHQLSETLEAIVKPLAPLLKK